MGQVQQDPSLQPGDPGASYSFNVGAIWAVSDPTTYWFFGHDPVVHVKGPGGQKP